MHARSPPNHYVTSSFGVWEAVWELWVVAAMTWMFASALVICDKVSRKSLRTQ